MICLRARCRLCSSTHRLKEEMGSGHGVVLCVGGRGRRSDCSIVGGEVL